MSRLAKPSTRDISEEKSDMDITDGGRMTSRHSDAATSTGSLPQRPLSGPEPRKLGYLSMDTVVDVASAKAFRAKHLGEKPLSLAIFPASCSPPTKQHMAIVRQVVNLDFVDQVWVDVNYESFTKDTLEKTYLHRLLMVQKEISKIPNSDTCILSKNLNLVRKNDSKETKMEKTRNYWEVCRVLCGEGKLSWVMGGDVFGSMVYWKQVGLIGLEAVDKLVVFSRTLSQRNCREIVKKVFDDDQRGLEYWKNKIQFIETGDISSSKAREALSTLLSCISLETMSHLMNNPKVMKAMIGWKEPDHPPLSSPTTTQPTVRCEENKNRTNSSSRTPVLPRLLLQPKPAKHPD